MNFESISLKKKQNPSKLSRASKAIAGVGLSLATQFLPVKAMETPLNQAKVINNQFQPTQIKQEKAGRLVVQSRSEIKKLVWTGQIKIGTIVQISGIKYIIRGEKETGRVGAKTIRLLEALPMTHSVSSQTQLQNLFLNKEIKPGDILVLPSGRKEKVAGDYTTNGIQISEKTQHYFASFFQTKLEANSGSQNQNKSEVLKNTTRKSEPNRTAIDAPQKPALVIPKVDLGEFLSKQPPKKSPDLAANPKAKTIPQNHISPPEILPKKEPQPSVSSPRITIADGRLITGYEDQDLRGPKLLHIEGITEKQNDFRQIIANVESFIAKGSAGSLEGNMAIADILRTQIDKGDLQTAQALFEFIKSDANDRYDIFPEWGTAKTQGDLTNYGKSLSKFTYNSDFFKSSFDVQKLKEKLDSIEKPSKERFQEQLRNDSRETMMALAGSISRLGGSFMKPSGVQIEFINQQISLKALTSTKDEDKNMVIRKLMQLSKEPEILNNANIQGIVRSVVARRKAELESQRANVQVFYPMYAKLGSLSYDPIAMITHELQLLSMVERNFGNSAMFLK
jgi:hypothetical protein